VQLLTGAKAPRAAVLSGLEQLSKVAADSSVIVYFSGHGEQVRRGRKSTYYLMPHGYDLDRLDETAISGAEFAAKLSRIKSERLLVLLDCCHAGGFGGAQALPEGAKSAKRPVVEKAPLPPEASKVFGTKKGRVLIASSTGNELSYAGEPYSVFTTALIAALCGEGAAKDDGYVRVGDLALYTREAVAKFTDGEQHPNLDFAQSDNFAVAYYAGGELKPKGLPASIKKPRVENGPGSNQFRDIDERAWTVIQGNVTNIQAKNVFTTSAEEIVFNMPGWDVKGPVTNIHGDQVNYNKAGAKPECPQCQTAVPPGARFCNQCGAKIEH
jgi:hypothetical protein